MHPALMNFYVEMSRQAAEHAIALSARVRAQLPYPPWELLAPDATKREAAHRESQRLKSHERSMLRSQRLHVARMASLSEHGSSWMRRVVRSESTAALDECADELARMRSGEGHEAVCMLALEAARGSRPAATALTGLIAADDEARQLPSHAAPGGSPLSSDALSSDARGEPGEAALSSVAGDEPQPMDCSAPPGESAAIPAPVPAPVADEGAAASGEWVAPAASPGEESCAAPIPSPGSPAVSPLPSPLSAESAAEAITGGRAPVLLETRLTPWGQALSFYLGKARRKAASALLDAATKAAHAADAFDLGSLSRTLLGFASAQGTPTDQRPPVVPHGFSYLPAPLRELLRGSDGVAAVQLVCRASTCAWSGTASYWADITLYAQIQQPQALEEGSFLHEVCELLLGEEARQRLLSGTRSVEVLCPRCRLRRALPAESTTARPEGCALAAEHARGEAEGAKAQGVAKQLREAGAFYDTTGAPLRLDLDSVLTLRNGTHATLGGEWATACVVVNAKHVARPSEFASAVRFDASRAPAEAALLEPATAARAAGFPDEAVIALHEHVRSHDHITQPDASPATPPVPSTSSLARALADPTVSEAQMLQRLRVGIGLHHGEQEGRTHHVDAAALVVLEPADFEAWIVIATERTDGWLERLRALAGNGATVLLQIYGVQGPGDADQILLNRSQSEAAEAVAQRCGPVSSTVLESRFWPRPAGAPGCFERSEQLFLQPDVLQRLCRKQFDDGCARVAAALGPLHHLSSPTPLLTSPARHTAVLLRGDGRLNDAWLVYPAEGRASAGTYAAEPARPTRSSRQGPIESGEATRRSHAVRRGAGKGTLLIENCSDDLVEGQGRILRIRPPLETVRVSTETVWQIYKDGKCTAEEVVLLLRRGLACVAATLALEQLGLGPRSLDSVLATGRQKQNGIFAGASQHIANAAVAGTTVEVLAAAACVGVKLLVAPCRSHPDLASTADVFEHRLLPWVLELSPAARAEVMRTLADSHPMAGALLLLNVGAAVCQRMMRDLTIFDGQGVTHAVFDEGSRERGRSLYMLCALYAIACSLEGACARPPAAAARESRGARRGRQEREAVLEAAAASSAAPRTRSASVSGVGASAAEGAAMESVLQRFIPMLLRLRGGTLCVHGRS